MIDQLAMFAEGVRLNAAAAVDDICAGRHHHTRESIEANPRRAKKENDRGRIYELVSGRSHGLTLDEASVLLDAPPNAISGRFTELVEAGALFKSGSRRPTRSGKYAAVYLAVSVEERVAR